MQRSGEVGRFDVVDLPSPPADRQRSTEEHSELNPYETPQADLGKHVDPAFLPNANETLPMRLLFCVFAFPISGLNALIGIFTGAIHADGTPGPIFLDPSTLTFFAISFSLTTIGIGAIVARLSIVGFGIICLFYSAYSFCSIWFPS